MTEAPAHVLIVDDSGPDAELVRDALTSNLPGFTVAVARDGLVALSMLEDLPAKARPQVVLLDLKMPRVDGFEVLRSLRKSKKTREIPVVIWTSSALKSDVEKAYSLGANSYVVKPMAFEALTRTVCRVAAYWLDLDSRPGAGGG